MGFGMGVLGWAPDIFWRATVPELKAAAAGRHGGAVLEETDIRALEALLAGEREYGNGN
jgi:uncharacterized phage protein (TIGR02216 family)